MEIDELCITTAMQEASLGFNHGECPDGWLDCNQARRIATYFADPTPITLDLLRWELGEPDRGGCIWTKSLPWLTWVENHKTLIIGDTFFVHALGQLRRMLSVLEETNGGE